MIKFACKLVYVNWLALKRSFNPWQDPTLADDSICDSRLIAPHGATENTETHAGSICSKEQAQVNGVHCTPFNARDMESFDIHQRALDNRLR